MQIQIRRNGGYLGGVAIVRFRAETQAINNGRRAFRRGYRDAHAGVGKYLMRHDELFAPKAAGALTAVFLGPRSCAGKNKKY